MKNGTQTISEYLVSQLRARGVDHVFGIPGDYVLGFYDELLQGGMNVVTTCDEQGAGFAADAYARLRGLGAVCVTYCVGGLKVANPIAGAFAEKSPVVVISGAPGMKERERNPLLHHKVRDFDTQKKVFEQITVASTVLSDPQSAFAEIDRVLHAALRYKRPVYIELPRDMIHARGAANHLPRRLREESDAEALAEAVAEATESINSARQPVILADVEVHRFGLQQDLLRLLEKTGIPFASTILGKSVISEQHPLYLGVYEGAMGREEVRRYVEASDCVLLLGAFMTDINLGIYTAQLDPVRCINASSERLSIRYHNFENVRFKDFLRGMVDAPLQRRSPASGVPLFSKWKRPVEKSAPKNRPLSVTGLFAALNEFLRDNTIVIADVGDALFGAADLFIHRGTEFLAPAYYTSMGFAVPAALGAQLANSNLRPLVLVGDGAFQMTGMELATIVRQKLDPIVIVLNNRGYGTERHIHEGPYNDLLEWRYHRIPDLLGAGHAWVATSRETLAKALSEAEANRDSFSLIEVRLDPLDQSPALRRLAERLSKRLR